MRETTLSPGGSAPTAAEIPLIRDEPRRIKLLGMDAAALVLTISNSPGGVPLIEIPGTGEITLWPELLQTLIEGESYPYNVWRREGEGEGELQLLTQGSLTLGNSIAPTGAALPTVFLNGFGQPGGPQRIVACSPAHYDALAVKDPDAIYILR